VVVEEDVVVEGFWQLVQPEQYEQESREQPTGQDVSGMQPQPGPEQQI
jgi:hypothetical protein